MRRKIQLIMLLIALSLSLNAQNWSKEVKCTSVIQTHFAIPEEVDVESLSSMDIVRMIAKEKQEEVHYGIDRNGLLTTTYTNLLQPEYYGDYDQSIYRMVSTIDGSRFYNHDNREIAYMRPEEDPEFNPDIYRLIPEVVRQFGLYNALFERPVDRQIARFADAGYHVRMDNRLNQLTAIARDKEIIVNFDNLWIEVHELENGRIVSLHYSQYQQIRDNIIPFAEKTVSYDTLPSGIQFQIIENKTIANYSIVQDKKTVVEFTNSKEATMPTKGMIVAQYTEQAAQPEEWTVYPNPANDKCTITFLNEAANHITVEIIDMQGKIVYSQKNASGFTIDLDISSLVNGSYLIRAGKDNVWNTTKIIKTKTINN
jgi:hypothetical protein